MEGAAGAHRRQAVGGPGEGPRRRQGREKGDHLAAGRGRACETPAVHQCGSV